MNNNEQHGQVLLGVAARDAEETHVRDPREPLVTVQGFSSRISPACILNSQAGLCVIQATLASESSILWQPMLLIAAWEDLEETKRTMQRTLQVP